jgi:hypothetical protein
MNESTDNSLSRVYDRGLLLHGSKRNEVLSLAEIERYGLDSFGNRDYISIYGMRPRDWYRQGIRVLGRTAVECTRDALGDRIGHDVASVATGMPSNEFVVIDPFAGSCNTLFWILRHLPNSEGIGFDSDPQVVAVAHLSLLFLIERCTGKSDHHQHHTEVHDVSAIAARVATRELHDRSQHPLAGLLGNYTTAR